MDSRISKVRISNCTSWWPGPRFIIFVRKSWARLSIKGMSDMTRSLFSKYWREGGGGGGGGGVVGVVVDFRLFHLS